jgi:hypothetical protein
MVYCSSTSQVHAYTPRLVASGPVESGTALSSEFGVSQEGELILTLHLHKKP